MAKDSYPVDFTVALARYSGMFRIVKAKREELWCFAFVLALVSAAFRAQADTTQNPYQPIIERNAFGLKPPPPPGSDAPPPPPPPPLAKVTLTGITSMFGPSSKRALLEIVEQEPGKAAVPRKPILREGERDGSVEVLAIDLEKNQVKIRNGTVETNITFEVQKTASAPAAPGALPVHPPPPPLNAAFPGAPNPAGVTPGTTGVNPAAPGGVTVFGATPPTPAPGTPPAGVTTYGAPATITYDARTATTVGPAQGGLRIPPRQVRTDLMNQNPVPSLPTPPVKP